MGDEVSEPSDRRASGLEVVVIAVLALPVLYVLSVGPVVKVAQWLDLDGDRLKTAYAPLIYLHDHTPMKKPLEWYIGVWGVH